MADWLLGKSHMENKDKERSGMNVENDFTNLTTDLPTCITAIYIPAASQINMNVQDMLHGWL